ncbi:hypothetical protein [Plasmodium yoelii yoelii]|uniref:Uncharacterized protein n=1 Tax=Plasmodium yoelii yoelii TaxID=73239 RepID=Q7REG8_PLAYO|nr:hypothetical protein [Plasmodium yoelii yoelii]
MHMMHSNDVKNQESINKTNEAKGSQKKY